MSSIPSWPWFKRLKVPPPEFRFLSFEESERLIRCAAPEWRALIVVALKTGLRVAELLALRWKDVDLHAARLDVRQAVSRGFVGTPKSGKGREVPLCNSALQALRSHRHLRGELVFPAADGSMLYKGLCNGPLWRAASVPRSVASAGTCCGTRSPRAW